MGDNDGFGLPLDLPNWNQGIQALFTQPRMRGDQGPPAPADHHLGSARRVLASTQPPHQATHHPHKRMHDPAAAHAAGLDQLPNANDAEFWLRKAADLEAPEAEAVLMEGLRRDAQPVTSIARALHELHKRVEGSPAEAQAGFPPLSPSCLTSAGRSLTPSRTGLTGKARRVPSRLADTPGAAGAAPPPTKFHGILKKLQFSAAGGGAAEDRPGGAPAPVPVPATATKRLHFCDGTPLASSLPGPTGLKASARRVTFGADTASPAPTRPRRGSGAPAFSFSFATPGAIAEGEEEGEEGGEEPAGGTVNSRNAGATPFDRRLSSLFAKYGDEGAAGGEEEGDKEQEQEGEQQGTPDLWRRLASASPADSVKMLTAADAEEGQGEKERGEGAGAEGTIKEESQQPQAMTPNAAIASVLGELLRRSLADIQAAKAAAAGAAPRQLPPGVVSPTAGVLAVAPASPAASPAPSPAPPPAAISSTPAPSLTPMSIDGVPRDEHGVPLVTPASVTMFRGASQAPARDDGIAADLLRSFDTPEVEVANGQQGAASVQRPGSAGSSGGGGGRASPEFEFRPVPAAPAAPGGDSAAAAGDSESASEGDTPDLQLKAACPARSGRLSPDSGAALPAPAAATPGPTPANTPIRGGIRLTPAANSIIASLGKAQRVLSPAPPAAPAAAEAAAAAAEAPAPEPAPQPERTPPPSITKELRGLMEGMALSTRAPGVMVVTPGDADADATQARRSSRLASATARKTVPHVAPAAPPAPAAAAGAEGSKENTEEAASEAEIAAAGPSARKTTPSRARRTPRAAKTPGPSPAQRYGLRSASKAAKPPAAEAATPKEALAPVAADAAGPSAARSLRRPSAGDKALQLSPTEQNIRSELRRSSRRKSTLEPSD